jgi:cytochrome c
MGEIVGYYTLEGVRISLSAPTQYSADNYCITNLGRENNMKKIAKLMVAAWLALAACLPVQADETRGTADEAVAMVKKAGAYYKANGREKSIAAFNDAKGEFLKGDLYVIMLSMNGDGITLAHGQNPKMVGKNILELKTIDGQYPIKEFLKIANSPLGHGWFDYQWPNSVTKAIEHKHTYVERHDDVLLAVGTYK